MKTLDDLPPEFHQIPDVQALYGILNGLLTGTKKLVIESTVESWTESPASSGYKVPEYRHTFRVENTYAKESK